MDKKYHRGGGEVVIPNKDIQPSSLTHFISIIQNLPVYAYCDPTLPVGWIEGEEVYMVKTNKPDIWKKVSGSYYYFKPKSYRRIWIEPKREQPHECQYCGAMTTQHDDQCCNNSKNYRFAEGEDDVTNQPDFQREAEELREQVRKLREGVEELIATIERNAVDNNTDIVNVKLWAKSWREEILNQPQ